MMELPSEFVMLIELGRKRPMFFPELGIAAKCEKPDSRNPHNEGKVRLILRKMTDSEKEPPPKKDLTRRRARR